MLATIPARGRSDGGLGGYEPGVGGGQRVRAQVVVLDPAQPRPTQRRDFVAQQRSKPVLHASVSSTALRLFANSAAFAWSAIAAMAMRSLARVVSRGLPPCAAGTRRGKVRYGARVDQVALELGQGRRCRTRAGPWRSWHTGAASLSAGGHKCIAPRDGIAPCQPRAPSGLAGPVRRIRDTGTPR